LGAQSRSRAPSRPPPVHLETYAKQHRWADPRHQPRRYIEQVEHQAVGMRLTQRLNLRLPAADPWVIDSLLALHRDESERRQSALVP
jgi:hypothetical protein